MSYKKNKNNEKKKLSSEKSKKSKKSKKNEKNEKNEKVEKNIFEFSQNSDFFSQNSDEKKGENLSFLSKNLSKMDKKNPNGMKFECITCNYYTNNRKDFNRHIKTKKHLLLSPSNPHFSNIKIAENNDLGKFKCICGKSYKWQSGLSKHKKKCQFNEMKNILSNDASKKTDELAGLLKGFMETQTEFNKELMENSQQPHIVNNNYQNSTNNMMTLNVFLHEKCKDALNLKDFIQNIQISLQDLTYTKDNGHAKGLSNIFVKNLADLEPTVRPIHCSNKKNMQFYVKDDGEWLKDENNTKIDKSIHDIKMIQIKKLQDWEKVNPNYLHNPKLLDEWQQLVHGVIGAADDYSNKMAKQSIKQQIGNSTHISKSLLIKND